MSRLKRDLLYILVLGSGIAGVLFWNLRDAFKRPEPPKLTMVTDAGPRGPDTLELAQRVASAFVAALRVDDFEGAYGQMARPYRESASVEAFRAAWKGTPLLASPQGVKLSRAHSEALQLPDGGFVAGATFTARGLMVVAAGALETSFTFLRAGDDAHVLAVFVGGIPVVQGLGPPGAREAQSRDAPTKMGSGERVTPKRAATPARTSRAKATSSAVEPPP